VKETPNAGLPTTDDALVLFEVLSRSNSKADQAWRRKVYASVPNCQHYVTVSLKAVGVVVYDRDTGWKARTVASLHDSLELAAIGFTMPVAEIYLETACARRGRGK
jgi:Uma2 family endonuclease